MKENQAICYSVDVAATNGTNLASWVAEAHAAWLFWATMFQAFLFHKCAAVVWKLQDSYLRLITAPQSI